MRIAIPPIFQSKVCTLSLGIESSQFWGFRDYLQIISAIEKEQNIYEAGGHWRLLIFTKRRGFIRSCYIRLPFS
jgi:hypothetical protein